MNSTRLTVARRFAAPVAAALLLAGAFAGTSPAAPAAALPTLSIPICDKMLPASTFTAIPGLSVARPYTPPVGTTLYGATSPTLQSIIRANPHRTCSWSAGLLDKSFTISEVAVDAADIASIRAWYASARITPRFYGGDAEFYAVPVKSPAGWTQVHILEPDGAWITVTDRYFLSAGAISQDAINRLVEINYWLEP
ncbi:MAG: hypothetical protein C0444_09070 [Microbacterium sp.]|nr:hypothetical protein [Microbacterium sp.]MBA4346510.1 hypothetical protein [Microbacterium sp.]